MSRIAGVLVLVLLPVPAGSAEPTPAALKEAVDQVLDRPAFAAAFWAAEIRSLKTGRVLYERNAGKNMTPASTMKLVTTAAALDAFGPDFRIRTTLESAGRLDAAGRILGDVFLVGRGDPLLSGKGADGRTSFDSFADALVAAGVRRIEGRLVGHEGLFKDRRAEDWNWSDLVWCYGAEVSALGWNDNCATLEVAAGERVGDPAVVNRSPLSRYYSLVSDATTSPVGTSSDLKLVRELGTNAIHLSGTQPIGAASEELEVALEDPARYATTVLAELLEARGIRVSGGVATSSDPLPAGVRELAVHDSPPLAEIINGVNKPSNNLHAEMLLRLLGARVKGEGSLTASLEAVRDFATRVGAPGLASSLQDGSGLSRTNMLRPHDVVELLLAMSRHAHAVAFRDSLPIAGVDGTLEHRLRGTAAERRVQAKTGTLGQTNALAGYATNQAGDRFVFSIVLNHSDLEGREGVSAIDAVVALLAR